MIEILSWPTPNGQKVHIAAEELELDFKIVPVNIAQGEQFKPEFLALNPNHRIPAIIDHGGPGGRFGLFESGAILIYLAERFPAKSGSRLIPADARSRALCLQWLMFQMGGVGPMFGQNNHFSTYAPEKIPYAIDRYSREAQRLVGVLETRLAEAAFLAGPEYSIADIATYPWIAYAAARTMIALDQAPALARWLRTLAARPGVERGMALMAEQQKPIDMTDEIREMLFGKNQDRRSASAI